MKNNDQKLKLINFEKKGNKKKISFASFLKTDFVDRGFVISLDEKNYIDEMYFTSNNLGSVEWKNGIGINDCHIWEDEEQAQAASNLSRRYTAILANGKADNTFAKKKIIPDILKSLEDKNFAELIKSIVKEKKYSNSIDISKFDSN